LFEDIYLFIHLLTYSAAHTLHMYI